MISFWRKLLSTFIFSCALLSIFFTTQAAQADLKWVSSTGLKGEYEIDYACILATHIEVHGTYDATIRWRSGDKKNKWVDQARSNGLNCNVGKRLSRLLELSSNKWSKAMTGFKSRFSSQQYPRCQNNSLSNCRGFRVSSNRKLVELGLFKRNKLEEGAVFSIDGTNAYTASFGSINSYPLRAIIFSNNDYIFIHGLERYFPEKTVAKAKPTLVLYTSDGGVFQTTTSPLCLLGGQTHVVRGKTCLAMSIYDSGVFFGEARRDSVNLRKNGESHYVGTHYIPEGTGIRVASDGSRYFGEFKDGLRHGPGTFANIDGSTVQSGQWKINVNYSKSVLPDYFNGFDTASILIQPNEQETITAAVPTTLVKKPETKALKTNPATTGTKPAKSNQIAVANVEGDELCRTVKGQLKNHVAQSDYEKAEQALSLLKKLDCVSGQSQATVSPNEPTYTQPTPSPAIISSPPSPKPGKELSCQAGPFFKPGLVTKPKTYHATSFDNNPRSNCSVAAKKCGSLAKIKLSRFKKEGSGSSSDSYTSRCSRYTGECTISRGSNSSGGFVGGLLEGLNDRANENEFFDGVLTECMIEEGFNITGR